MVFAFGDHRLDIERRELRRGSDPVALEPQVFDVLAYLVENRHRVVPKNDLLQAVWDGRIVSDSALTTRINAARRAIGDSGAAQRLIRTFHRKGVRFVGAVSEAPGDAPAGRPAAAGSAAPQPAALEGPSIAVLPFQNLSGDPEQEYFADGMVEEIITALSRIRWLFVIARNSSFTYKGQTIEVKRVGRELGVRYLLEGSVRRAGRRVRITAQLVDATSGTSLWADRFDGALKDVFDLQDEVASSVAGVIEPALQAAETERAARRPTHDLTAYDAYLRACAMLLSSAGQIPQALALLEEAIARDPHYGPALAWAAICHQRFCMDGTSRERAADTRQAAAYARRALVASPDDPGVLVNAALPLAYAGEDIDAVIALVDRALGLNPNSARGWYVSGVLKNWAGDPEAAIARLDHAMRLSPRGRIGTVLTTYGNALVFARRFEEAAAKILLAIHEDPEFPPNYRLLAVAYAHLGRLEEARAALARLPAAAPLDLHDLAQSYRAMFRKAEHRKIALTGLRLALGEAAAWRSATRGRPTVKAAAAGG